jgi:hypothetical protein
MALGLTLPQFATALMRELKMAENLTPVQLQILYYLIETSDDPVEAARGMRKIICGFRGVGKSTLTAITGIWWLDEDPNEKLLFVSASGGFAKKITTWMLTTIKTVPWLSHLRPDTKEGRYSNIEFDVGACTLYEQSPSVRAAGIYGQVTGSRASKVIVDDCETPQTCLTQLQRERLRSGLDECESIIKPDQACDIFFLGTPHASVESVYFFLQKNRNYAMRMWPARVPVEAKPYRGLLAPLISRRIGVDRLAPTDTRFSDDTLTQKQLRMSPARWRLQFMLDPTQSDAEKHPLKCRDLLIATLDDDLPEVLIYEKSRPYEIDDLHCAGMGDDSTFYRPALIQGTVRAADVPTILVIDPSGGGADEFAWAVMSAWGGNFYLRALGGRRGGSSEALWLELATLAKRMHVKKVLVESNFGGLAVWEQAGKPSFLRIGYPVTFEGVRTGGTRKELRMIDTLAPVVQLHSLIVDRRIIEEDAIIITESEEEDQVAYSFMYQYTRLTEARGCLRHDDKLDVTALGVEFFQNQAAQDQQVRAAERRMEFLRANIEDEAGRSVMNGTRLAMGMSLEQAKRAAVGETFSSGWLDD